MYKWYFYGVDAPQIAWNGNRDKAFKYSSRESAQQESDLLNRGHHLIRPSDGGARLLFHNFRVEETSDNTFVICFDAEPQSRLGARS
jgi:hypothetical protein